MKSLDISIPNEYITVSSNISDPIENIILKYANHPSIISINSNITKSTFSFSVVNVDDIKTELDALNCKKSCKSDSIPPTFLKHYSSICSEPLHNIINYDFRNATFDQDLKYADITPVHKKDDTTDESNYRPISLLPVVAKMFEKFMQKQIVLSWTFI